MNIICSCKLDEILNLFLSLSLGMFKIFFIFFVMFSLPLQMCQSRMSFCLFDDVAMKTISLIHSLSLSLSLPVRQWVSVLSLLSDSFWSLFFIFFWWEFVVENLQFFSFLFFSYFFSFSKLRIKREKKEEKENGKK